MPQVCVKQIGSWCTDFLSPYLDFLGGIANFATVFVATVALIAYFRNREKISYAIKILFNFSFQLTLGELKEKLERLNEYNAGNAEHLSEIRNILHEIAGQWRGNHRLFKADGNLPHRLESFAASKRMNEPTKRALVSEIREILRNLQVATIQVNSENTHE